MAKIYHATDLHRSSTACRANRPRVNSQNQQQHNEAMEEEQTPDSVAPVTPRWITLTSL